MFKFNSALLAVLMCPVLFVGQESHSGKAQMSIPGVPGVLEFDPGPTTWQSRVRPDGLETQLRAMNRPDGLNISAFLQKVTFDASPEKCRSEWWPGTRKSVEQSVSIQKLKQSTRDGIALVEYLVPEFQGKPVRMQTMHAYVGGRNLCAELHLSKASFTPEDQKLFDAVLASVRLAPDQSAQSSVPAQSDELTPDQQKMLVSLQSMAQAHRLFMDHNYSAAAERYQQVLEAEKGHPTLTKTFFRVLVDELGMSYGIPGNLLKAKETFEYGISRDPEYPLFYYNMACTYGEMGKKQDAVDQLKLAYRYKANMIAGEEFPDPLKDDSFRKFVSDNDFVQAVKTMQKQ